MKTYYINISIEADIDEICLAILEHNIENLVNATIPNNGLDIHITED